MLALLQLSGIRDQLDNLLDEAARANLSARETLILLCERKIERRSSPHRDGAELAHFPTVKELAGFERGAAIDQSEADPRPRRVTLDRHGENVLLLGPSGLG
ncbi:ATP-binding protein [Bradyrhizobium sp. 23]|uniref:ATP-binding protein n=1 Tax=Bradyrhizobium sp. 23 TaxID=2782667 RepID=UPI001FF73F98